MQATGMDKNHYLCGMDTTKWKDHHGAMQLLAVAMVAAVVLLPFVGLTDFNSKGEPREAVVAVSMLNSGNFILPENNGGDIPYKPPFFHFCIALASMVGGSVTETTSRLPSALAMVAMVAGCFGFFSKRKGLAVAALAAGLTLTSFEVHRAAMACRVDMMLTAFMVGAMLCMYRWHERGARGLPWWGIACMSGAVLTKGPVGFVLPCLVMGCFMLVRDGRFWRAFATMAASGLLACVVPLMWYVAAYGQGGERFLDLVMEENLGRMTGTMSYESHAHPFTYNFITLATGWLPWTLLLLFGLAAVPWRRCKRKVQIGQAWAKLRAMDAMQLYVWMSFVLVLVFYCLPSSKRSVYLLPCYPFMAVLIAEFIVWLLRSGKSGVVRAFALVVAVLALLLSGAFAFVRMGLLPDTLFAGKHAAENMAMAHALRDNALGFFGLLLVLLPVAAAAYAVYVSATRRLRTSGRHVVGSAFAVVFALYLAFDGVYQPAVMNTKSLRPMAQTISQRFGGEKLYSYVSIPMMHFFGANFYLGDAIKLFEKPSVVDGKQVVQTPREGVLIVPRGDADELMQRHADYKFSLVMTLQGRPSEMKDAVSFYRFSALSTK